ncbi:MAG TPA: endonuclease/exonuclease/phosphatase family protein, partial [Mycobacteriales bacterium]|nr:endonuclease/exonuclease/phosphatase family protein [Mycobacteriales bacterium]
MGVTTPRRSRALLRAFALVLVAGVVQAPAAAASPPEHAQRQVPVASYNLYLGANLTPLFTATPATVATLAQDVWDHVEQVDFRVRARAIARLIDGSDPTVVGLQEVALWERGPTPAALTPAYDFQQILLDALAARGEPYRVASVSRNFQSPAIPLASGGVARFTDRDVILVRDGEPASVVRVANPRADLFAARIPLPNPLLGNPSIVRGWASVDVTVRGKSFRFVDTHLEAYSGLVRGLQAAELAAILAVSPLPVVLVGDLNSRPDDSSGAYGILTSALGLRDAWTDVHGPAGGDTSGQTDDLNLLESRLDHRIDFVLYQPPVLDAVDAEVLGEEQADRTPPLPGAPYGLWPSDHAGVAATLHLSRP